MMKEIVKEVVLDGSERTYSLELNGIPMTFRDDEDAHKVFDILNATRDRIMELERKLERAEGLARTVLHHLESR